MLITFARPSLLYLQNEYGKYAHLYGEGNGNPLQYSYLENRMDRGVWQATVHGVARVGHDLATKPPPPPLILQWRQLQVKSSGS